MKIPRWRGARGSLGAPASLILLGLTTISPAAAQVAQVAQSAQSATSATNATTGATISAPAASGQQALAVRVGPQGITARVCASGACSPEGGARVDVPAEIRTLLAKAQARAIGLADGKQVVRIEVPGAREPEAWVMLIAAPLAGKPSEPVFLWSGFTGSAKGEHGEGRVSVVLEEKLAPLKGSRLLIGEQREDVSICGRPTLVSVREVAPATMDLARGAAVQNIPAEERAKAVKLAAVRVEPARAPAASKLLKATAASSAVDRKFATLTDGDAETAWSENKAGIGRGEFVTMSSAVDAGITSLEIAIRPETEEIAAPKTLLFATSNRLLEVTIPDDAGRKAGGLYEVKLPEELRTACLAVVLEDAHAPRSAKSPRVTIAEIAARTALSDLDPTTLAGALAGGGERAKSAAALLSRIGPPGMKAAMEAYPKLDDDGKRLALDVIETSPCSAHVGFFAERLRAPAPFERAKQIARAPASLDPETEHALDRIRRCGRTAAPALAELIATGADRTKIIAAAEIALIAPAEAVPALLDAIPAASEATRRELRKALANAAKSDRSKGTLGEAMGLDRFKARPEVVQIDLLRAIGPRLGVIEGSSQAFAALAVPGASFRTRYLLQAPAAELARSGDARALAFVRDSLRKDPDPPVRARAAEAAARVPSLLPDLVTAVDDREVRVREAAIIALGRAMSEGARPGPTLAPALSRRLTADPWTFIRSGAASALGSLPASPEADKALAGALADLSSDVRGRALDALGAHRAVAYAEPIRERVADPEEHIEVRARAILALAAMCDKSSIDDFTKYAMRAARPLDERDRRLGSAAVAALGILHPPDLSARLAPLMSKAAPAGAREMARAAIAAEPACR